jgi:hypothetical protein
MTAQICDTVEFNGLVYQLAEFEGTGLFDPKEHGFKPMSTSTACWRGFVCGYRVLDEHLVLNGLAMGLSGAEHDKLNRPGFVGDSIL